jgi:hypothetical protein
VLPSHLPSEIVDPRRQVRRHPRTEYAPSDKPFELEKERIAQTLTRTGGNAARVARVLGLERGALRYRKGKCGISKDGTVLESKRSMAGETSTVCLRARGRHAPSETLGRSEKRTNSALGPHWSAAHQSLAGSASLGILSEVACSGTVVHASSD